jgi:hypothetical protein
VIKNYVNMILTNMANICIVALNSLT